MLKLIVPIVHRLNEEYLTLNLQEKAFLIIKTGLSIIIEKFEKENQIISRSDIAGITKLKETLKNTPHTEEEFKNTFHQIESIISNLNWPFYGASYFFNLHNYGVYKTLWVVLNFLKNPELIELCDYLVKRNYEIKLSKAEITKLNEEIVKHEKSESKLKDLLVLARSDTLLGKYEKAQEIIQKLTLDNSLLTQEKEVLHNIITSQEKEITDLKLTIASLKENIKNCLSQIKTLDFENGQIKEKNNNLESRLSKVEETLSSPEVFFLSHQQSFLTLLTSQGYKIQKFNPPTPNNPDIPISTIPSPSPNPYQTQYQ